MAGKYDNEFKERIIMLYNGGSGKSGKNLAKEYGVPESTVRYWVVDKPSKEDQIKE